MTTPKGQPTGRRRVSLSVCLISGAEVNRIGPTLASVCDWVGEIVVVLNDTVRDGTQELCERHGARVFREPWKGHVDQKNSSAAKATQPWILGLDADEVVTTELRSEIEVLLSQPPVTGDPVAYSVPRLSSYAGRQIRHGDWYPDRKLRLWKRGQARWTGTNPHDRLEADGPTGRLRGDLLHFSNEDLNHQLMKIRAYSDDFVRDRRQRGRGFSLVETLTRPPWRFFRGYVLRLGFLDGWPGFCISVMTAFYTFVKYAKLREAQSDSSPPPS